jgi:hypothetical protein
LISFKKRDEIRRKTVCEEEEDRQAGEQEKVLTGEEYVKMTLYTCKNMSE